MAVLWFCGRPQRRLLPEQSRAERAASAGLAAALFLAALPGAGEILYWSAGMACYLPLLRFAWHLAQLAAAPRGATLSLLAIEPRPKLLWTGEPSPDPAHWFNRCLATYFGLGSVVLAPPGA